MQTDVMIRRATFMDGPLSLSPALVRVVVALVYLFPL